MEQRLLGFECTVPVDLRLFGDLEETPDDLFSRLEMLALELGTETRAGADFTRLEVEE